MRLPLQLHSHVNATIGHPSTSSLVSVYICVVPQAHSLTLPFSPTPAVLHFCAADPSCSGALVHIPQGGSAATSPLLQLHVPQSPLPGQVAPAAPFYLRVFQPLPFMSTPSLCATALTQH